MKSKKCIAAMLCGVVALSAVSGIVGNINTKHTRQNAEPKGFAVSAAELENVNLSKSDLPVGLSYDEAVAEGHKVRLYSEEPNEYTAVFQNSDDTRTMYYFNNPITFTGKNGEIKNIDNSVEKVSGSSKYAYKTKQSKKYAYFPKRLETGVMYNGDKKVEILPEIVTAENWQNGSVATKGSLLTSAATKLANVLNISNDQTAESDGETVEYANAFGENTVLRCAPLTFGVKQDAILNKNVGKNSFSFLFNFVDSNAEIEQCEDGSLGVYDKDSDEAFGYILPIKVYDANGKEAQNCRYDFEKTEDGSWRVTAVVDNDFLNDPNTVYPVTVDPDYIDTPAYGATDVTCYKSNQTKNDNASTTLYIGNRSNGGVTRVLLGFHNLDLTLIDPAQMFQAYFSLKDTRLATGEVTVAAYEYFAAWNKNTVTWKSADLGNTAKYSSSAVATRKISKALGAQQSHTNRYYFNILETAKRWCKYERFQSYGFMLKCDNESKSNYYAQVASMDATSNKPTLVFRYYPAGKTIANGDYYFKNPSSSKYMTHVTDSTNNVRQNSFTGNDNQKWTVEYASDGYYYIYEYKNKNRSLKVEYLGTSNNVRTATSSGSEYQLYRIIASKYGYRIFPKKYLKRAVELASDSANENINVVTAVYDRKKFEHWQMQKVLPDLTVSAGSASGNTVNNNVTVNATIKNTYAPAGNSSAKITVTSPSGKTVVNNTVSVGALAANATKGISATFKPTEVGSYKAVITADSASNVAEHSESNNTRTFNFNVAYNDINEPTNDNINNANLPVINLSESSTSDYGKKYSATVSGNKLYHDGDVDFFKLSVTNGAHTQVVVPQNCTVTFYDSSKNQISSSSNAGKYLKSNNKVCYIRVNGKKCSYNFAVDVFTLN